MYLFVQIQYMADLGVCRASMTHPEGQPLSFVFYMTVLCFRMLSPPLPLPTLHAQSYEWKGNSKS